MIFIIMLISYERCLYFLNYLCCVALFCYVSMNRYVLICASTSVAILLDLSYRSNIEAAPWVSIYMVLTALQQANIHATSLYARNTRLGFFL